MAEAIRAENVSIRYILGDFKDIGIKEYVVRHLSGNYHIREFWADKDGQTLCRTSRLYNLHRRKTLLT